jgi:acid phosphatase type 7
MRRSSLSRRARRPLLTFATVLLAGCLLPDAASAERRVFTPVADAYVSSDAVTANLGTSPMLRVDASPTRRSYLTFDVALPKGAVITGAALRLFTTSSTTITGYQVHAVADASWSEATISFDGAPPFGEVLGSSGDWSTTGYKEATLPAQALRPGVMSLGASTTSPTAKPFDSREGANKPELVVDFSLPTSSTACADGVDNDGDGKVDLDDPGCAKATDDDETDPPPGPHAGDRVIIAAGDIQAPGSPVSVSAPLLSAPFDALLTLGDNQYERGSLDDYNAWYSQTWGAPGLKPVTYPTPGNHERESGLRANYCEYFRNGVNGPAAVDPCPGGLPYYSYELGAWHMIALDSSAGTIGAAQLQWLDDDLARHPTKCTLAYWHHARYSGGPHGNATLGNVWAHLMAAGVDAVLVGHDHNYQRFAPMNNAGGIDRVNGIREFVVGTGGRSHYGVSAVTGQESTNDDAFGVLRMTLGDGGYAWRFVPETGKFFSDSGTDRCR